jgi:hypothetical protein
MYKQEAQLFCLGATRGGGAAAECLGGEVNHPFLVGGARLPIKTAATFQIYRDIVCSTLPFALFDRNTLEERAKQARNIHFLTDFLQENIFGAGVLGRPFHFSLFWSRFPLRPRECVCGNFKNRPH